MLELLCKNEKFIKSEIETFLRINSNENGINVSKLYIGNIVIVDREETLNAGYLILIGSLCTPHDEMYIDIINNEAYSLLEGFTSFGSNWKRGYYVRKVIPLSRLTDKEKMKPEELKEFINEYNKQSIKEENRQK